MYVYILKSIPKSNTYYIGLTSNPKKRLETHNRGESSHTSKSRPWKIKNVFWFENKDKAINFEKYLKSGSGRAFCKKHF